MSKALSLDVLSLYHEILINEIALMRANSIADSGIDIDDTIVYVSPLPHNPSVTRGLDYILLIYALVNGARRLECGYNVLDPLNIVNIDSYCIKKVWNRLKEVLNKLIDGVPHLRGLVGDELESVLAGIVFALLHYGLLFITVHSEYESGARYSSLDTVNPLKLHFSMKRHYKEGYAEVEVSDIRVLNELRVYGKVMQFLRTFGIDVEKAINKFKELSEKSTGVRLEGKLSLLNIQFKTLHGMLFKSLSYAAALPEHFAVMEVNVLPFVIEPLPISIRNEDVKELDNQINNQVGELLRSSSSYVEEEVIKIIGEVIKQTLRNPLTEYQHLYLKKMFEVCSSNNGRSLTVITSPTGTGKTYIFLFYALAKLIDAKIKNRKRKQNKRPHILILYPRKALARDQLSKIIEAVNYVNEILRSKRLEEIKVGIYDGDRLRKDEKEITELRGLKLGNKKLCHGIIDGKYKVFLTDSERCELNEKAKEIDWLYDYDDISILEKEGIDILISNHSILTKLIFETFAKDIREFKNFVKDLEVLILDEAHLYLEERLIEVLAPTLFKLFVLRAEARNQKPVTLDDLANSLNMDIIISSATLTDSNIITKEFNGVTWKMSSQFVVGFFKVKRGHSSLADVPQSLRDFLKKLLTDKIYKMFEDRKAVIYYDFDTILAKHLQNEGIYQGAFKIKIALTLHPHPRKQSWTSLAESMITLIHFINAIRSRMPDASGAQALVFVDMKSTLKDIFRTFLRRQILEAQDHADRVLLTGRYIHDMLRGEERIDAKNIIIGYIDSKAKERNLTAFDLIYLDPYLKDFNELPFYIRPGDLKSLFKRINNYNDFLNIIMSLTLSKHIDYLISSLNDFAKESYNNLERGWHNYIDSLKSVVNRCKDCATIFIHYGDLGIAERSIIESCMKKERYPIPLVIMATSTLEIGVDIKDVAVVFQYASYPHSTELMQRFGRSGRDISSFLVSTLVLVLRNTGEDLRYVIDQEAVEYVYNLKIPHVKDVFRDRETIVRSMHYPLLLSLPDEKKALRRKVNDKIKYVLSMLEKGLNEQYIDVYYRWYNAVFVEASPYGETIPQDIREYIEDIIKTFNKLRQERPNLKEISYISYLWQNNYADIASRIEYVQKLFENLKKIVNNVKAVKAVPFNLLPLVAEIYEIQTRVLHLSSSDSILGEIYDVLFDIYIKTVQMINSYVMFQFGKNIGKKALKRFLWSYIPPGVTNDIGEVKTGIIVYPPIGGDIERDRELEPSEAFNKIRPLHTGE